ncbi:unnamed protein product [Linum trigynum]|uniref:Uncharacterized protein n=1 Tax=Linum trigynum TaxID=586398 RepID=A0AAV2CTD6_9ROSI
MMTAGRSLGALRQDVSHLMLHNAAPDHAICSDPEEVRILPEIMLQVREELALCMCGDPLRNLFSHHIIGKVRIPRGNTLDQGHHQQSLTREGVIDIFHEVVHRRGFQP